MSERQSGGSDDAKDKKSKQARKVAKSDTKNRKSRAGDVGRALRTIYDDTVREPVPDDFLSLLGKLS